MAARVPPGQIVTTGFPVLHAGAIPIDTDPTRWRVAVHGAVQRPRTFEFEELLQLPQLEQTVDIHCVTSWTKLGTTWTGVPFREIAEKVAPLPEAQFVAMECAQGFTTSLPLKALMEGDVILAHSFGGKPLPAEHGGPLRMLVPRRYFYKSAKWLQGLKFLAQDEPGFWEVRGYSNVADPWLETRYTVDDVRQIHRMRKESLFRPVAR